MVTGPAELAAPVNHVLPAWDVTCGIYAALSVVTALRHRDATGQGQRISIPLENVALATAGNLSFLTEVMVNGTSRARIGNSIYGQYGQEFTSSDGVSFMIVALTEPPLPRPHRAHRNREGRCRTCQDARRRLHRRGRAIPTPRRAHRAVRRVVLRAHGRGGGRSAVGVIGPVGALPHLRRSGRRRTGDGQSDVHPAGPAPSRRIPGAGPARRRSTATTRRPSLRLRSATTPAACSPNGWGSSKDDIDRLDRVGHRSMSRLLKLLELHAGQR